MAVTGEIVAALQGILDDLGLPGHAWSVEPGPESVGVAWQVNVAGAGEVWLSEQPLEESVVALADQLQAYWIDATWRALPACVGDHPHPLSARLVDGEPVWVCPGTAAVVARIGSLGP